MKTVLVKRSVVASGKHLKPGQVYDLSRQDALVLIRMGKAVPAEKEPVQVDNREQELNSSMTVKEVKAKLQERGVDFPYRATKKQLLELI